MRSNMFLGSYGYSNSFNGPASPFKTNVWGSACSPFRNTNTPLQDITMGQTLFLPNGTNPKSPGQTPPARNALGGTGPGVGRTMKDYEDQLATLQKENFQLKLRIYFLEEKMCTASGNEDAVKMNIQLKVEIESLKTELFQKQELLSQAAKAFSLFEEQKENLSKDENQYQKSLEAERQRIAQLERELEEYRSKLDNTSVYYKEAFGITPEKALENQEKIQQMEAFMTSLDGEVKQLTNSLEDERSWTSELENERDTLKIRLDNEIRMKENSAVERNKEIEELRERIKDLEDQIFKKDNILQQYKNDITEKERMIKEKNESLKEKSKLYEEISLESDKKKKQIEHLRMSVKTRDDTITDINNKHRVLLSQFENNCTRRTPPSSPSTFNSFGDFNLVDLDHHGSSITSPSKNSHPNQRDWILNRDKSVMSPTRTSHIKALEERDNEMKRHEEEKKQWIVKLCNAQKSAEISEHKFYNSEQRLKTLDVEYQKALKSIQALLTQVEQMEMKNLRKERKIMDLEIELEKSKDQQTRAAYTMNNSIYGSSMSRESEPDITRDNPERDHWNQQRFENMEKRISDLRDQIDIIKAEKCRLEKQIRAKSEELQGHLFHKEQMIELLEHEKSLIKKELKEKTVELDNLKAAHEEISFNTITSKCTNANTEDVENLKAELDAKNGQIEEQNRRIVELSKELQVQTQNLQKLVNTELWNKNKEIAKLHNHITSPSSCLDKTRPNKYELITENSNNHLTILLKELSDIGIKVTFTHTGAIELNYLNGDEMINIETIAKHIENLLVRKNELEKGIDYLKWLKLVSQSDTGVEENEYWRSPERKIEKINKYCELLRTHLKDLVRFIKDMLKDAGHKETFDKLAAEEHKKILLEVLLSLKFFSDDFVKALKETSAEQNILLNDPSAFVKNGCLENAVLEVANNQVAVQSDSEAFSEPDRAVSMARIGLQEIQTKFSGRVRSKYIKQCHSDSEDSLDYMPYHSYHDGSNNLDVGHQVKQLTDTNNSLYSELSTLRNDLMYKKSSNGTLDERLVLILLKAEKSQIFCARLQSHLDRRTNECNPTKKENKRDNSRKGQLERRITDIENMAIEITKEKTELFSHQENFEKKHTETIKSLNQENDALKSRIKKLEDQNEAAKISILTLTKEMDHLTLSHSQILVENTKLTNDRLKLEQEMRKTQNRHDDAVQSMHDKFDKEILELNQINDSHRTRVQELETTNKELRRHVAICEASDSAPSSSGVSSIPTEMTLKQSCEDLPDYQQSYNISQYWLPVNYPVFSTRSKSSCSPDLGIESDAAVTTTRPLKDTLKITESMTNLLSDDDNGNHHSETREVDNQSPLFIEGLDEVEALKQENETLKRKLMKTRKALEETFQHVSASNKNKKNVEKAIITKQLMITKGLLKKTKTYEDSLDN